MEKILLLKAKYIKKNIFTNLSMRNSFFVLEGKIQLIVHRIKKSLLLFSQVETNLSGALFCF